MSADKTNPQEIFFQAIEIESVKEQQDFLDRACEGNDELRAKVDGLIRAYQAAGSFLEEPIAKINEENPSDVWEAANATQDETTDSGSTGGKLANIGPYKLLQQIGEGGMGSVYMAQQEKPVKRRVALKVIKAGMDSKQVIARFEAERQALALMDHPNIARLLDVGTTDSGRPYFVMELVKGVPITDYCDQKRLNVAERLGLFSLVCNAVQHAHQKGIIHRDLKPNNILITEYDEKVVPKIIDFGLAKALGQNLTDKTMFTQFGQVMGTLAYMSPEQSKVNAFDIDTRADIYSLGVLLYELLTGSTPFNEKTLRGAAFDQVLKIIREETPQKPSTRLSSEGTDPQIAPNRNSDPAKLGRLVRGDLDWIVLKALEKERSRRYETANAFSDDIDRYLNNEVIIARPPTAGYKFSKFVKKHRGLVTACLMISLTLVAGIIGTSIGLYQSSQKTIEVGEQKAIVEAERDNAKAQQAIAIQQKERADRHLERSLDTVQAMLTNVSEHHLADQPYMTPVRRKLLEDALGFYQDFLVDESDSPLVQQRTAWAYKRVGNINVDLGDHEKAEQFYRKSVESLEKLCEQHPDVRLYAHDKAAVHSDWGSLMATLGKTKLAEENFRTAIELYKQHRDSGELTYSGKFNLANTCGRLGSQLGAVGRFQEAEDLLQESVTHCRELVARDPDSHEFLDYLSDSLHRLGVLADRHGQAEKAEELFQSEIETRKKTIDLAPDNFKYIQGLGRSYHSLGIVYRRQNRVPEAIPSFREALKIKENTARSFPFVPQYQKQLTSTQTTLGYSLMDQGEFAEAEPLFQSSIAKLRKLVDQYPKVVEYKVGLGGAINNRAVLFNQTGRFEESKAMMEEAMELQNSVLATNPNDMSAKRNLHNHYHAYAYACMKLGEVDDFSTIVDKLPTPSLNIYANGVSECYLNAKANPDQERQLKAQSELFGVILTEIEDRLTDKSDDYIAQAWLHMFIPAIELRDAERGLELAQEAVELDQNSSEAWNTLALAHYRNEAFDDAIEAGDRSMKLGEEDPESSFVNWLIQAMAFAKKNEIAEAQRLLENARQWSIEHGPISAGKTLLFNEAKEVIGINK